MIEKYSGLILSVAGLLLVLFVTGCTPAEIPQALDAAAATIGGWGAFSAIIAGVIEFIIRLFPTANPKSLIMVVSEILHSLGNLAEALSKFLDKIGFQVVKQ